MDVLLLKQELEEKYRLFELLKDHFKIKIIAKNDFITVKIILKHCIIKCDHRIFYTQGPIRKSYSIPKRSNPNKFY